MDRAQLPLNALRAFEAAARHLSFTRAAIELCVSQGAVSHQVAALERRLGAPLFRRLPRGLALTDEGQALIPVVGDSLDRIAATLDRFVGGRMRETLTVGVVGTFALGWLIPRLDRFVAAHPEIDLRLMTNNNRVDLAGEGLDYAIRFGDGTWHGTHADLLMPAPFTPLCAPAIADRLGTETDLSDVTLLRSYRSDEWPRWFASANLQEPRLTGPVFDSSAVMIAAAETGYGIALAPVVMFRRQLESEHLVRPFQHQIDLGQYWLTRLHSRRLSDAMRSFSAWLEREIDVG